jgi:hypothetical protein
MLDLETTPYAHRWDELEGHEERTMHALLGKITEITRTPASADFGNGAARWTIRFKAACVMPDRSRVPEWLKEPVLMIEREAADPRELGHPGDSILLTPAESARWLQPLAVTPSVAYGKPPQTLQLSLRWWKEEKLPEYRIQANGRWQTGQFTRDGDGGVAQVDTASFFEFEPSPPVALEVTCDKITAACTVLPESEPYTRKLLLPAGERHRLENRWYRIDVNARSHGGGIEALVEKGRGVDHFRCPENRIQQAFHHGGHIDRFTTSWDWSDKMQEVAMTCAGSRREGASTRLGLEGVVDEGQNLRTSAVYSLPDALPLLLLERNFHFLKGKGKEGDGKEKDEKPKEPIDDMKPIRLGFRAAWRAERDGATGSRLLCVDGERLAVIRCAQVGEYVDYEGWRMSDGWALTEHPGRREYTLYMFDRQAPPHLATWLGAETLTLEPFWPFTPARPDESLGYSLALTAGEIGGADVTGAWIACRAPLTGGQRPTGDAGGCRCAVVGRLRDTAADVLATLTLGGETRETPLQRALVPGIGSVSYAILEFPEGRLDHPFDGTVARIPSRRRE